MHVLMRQLRNDDEIQDLVLEVVQWLSEGACVGIPTAHGYVGLVKGIWQEGEDPTPVRRWLSEQISSERSAVSLAVALQHVGDLPDFFRPVPSAAERLLSRHQPGALVALIPGEGWRYATSRPSLQTPVLSEWRGADCRIPCLMLSGKIGPLIQALCPWPLLAVLPALEEAEKAAQPIRTVCELTDLIPAELIYRIDAGELGEASPRAIVEIQSRGVKIIQAGQITDTVIMERSGPSILFVCTGNTCRSPMAAAICRKLLADRLECSPEELGSRGIEIASAGIAADYGYPASPEAVELLAADGIGLSGHQSQPLSAAQLDRADLILTMTAHHRLVILNHRPDLSDRVRVLGSDSKDIPDPIGCSLEVYRQCREAIEKGLQPIIEEVIREL